VARRMKMSPFSLLFEEFLRERRYIKNITHQTEQYYRQSWNSYVRRMGEEPLTKPNLIQWVIKMREDGVKPVSCNTFISGMNAFCNWLYENNHLPEKLTIKKLKFEQTVLKPLDETQLKAIISFRASTKTEKRIWTIVMTLLDTGCRIEEILTLTRDRVDFENLLLTVHGKGNKERIIPFSLELRKILFKYLREHKFPFVFCTRDGGKLNYHNAKRDYKNLCVKLKIERTGTFHRFRHTFALNYVRSGGGLFHLQKQLGHTTLQMTRRYTELDTSDLAIEHAKTSILSKLR
jgi:integrase/recombinase XerD